MASSDFRFVCAGSQSSDWFWLPPTTRRATGGSLTLEAFCRLPTSCSSTTRFFVHPDAHDGSEFASRPGSVASKRCAFLIGPECASSPANTRWTAVKVPLQGLLPLLLQVSPPEVPIVFSQLRLIGTEPRPGSIGIVLADTQRWVVEL